MSWLRLHRRIMRSDVSHSDELLGLFVRLLASVNYRPKWFRGVEIQPGQMAFAFRLIRQRLYSTDDAPSKNTIMARLKKLRDCGVIQIAPHSSKRFSILTIVNWTKYQSKTTEQPYPNSGTVPGTAVGTVLGTVPGTESRREKKVKKEKNSESEYFESWYSAYPRKVARKTAEKAHSKALDEICRAEGVDRPQAAKLLLQWTQERLRGLLAVEEKFQPHPASWLNAGRYRDVVTHSTTTQQIQPAQPETKIGDYVRKPKPGRVGA